ncbi:MAG: peptidoglycan D,D-transpeptidase FtsI family protein [Actinomycetes bacterium]
MLLGIAIALSLCAGRLLQLQGLDSSAYAATAAERLTRTLPLLPSRGDITDRNGQVLASTQAAVAVTADPKLTGPRAAEVAAVIGPHLQMTTPELIPILTKPNTRFTYVKKKVPALTYSKLAAELTARELPGIFRESDPIRTSPGRSVGAGVVGFVGADGKGLGGLELARNTELAGIEGREVYESSPTGSKIPLGNTTTTPAQNGLNYQLTVDAELQWVAEERVADQVRKSGADSGFAVVLNVKTGEVLALANAPTFDASAPGKADAEDRGNRAISAPYEPGSVQKILTAAALMDSKTTVGGLPITPDTRVRIPSTLKSGPFNIKDHFAHGELRFRMRGVVAESSNIGTVLLTRQMPKATLRDYLSRFGLGRPTGIELPGEAAGILPDADMRDLTRDQVAFGQALSVTGIQQAAAIAGIVNDGLYQPPTVVKAATTSDGQVAAVPRQPARQVVSPQTSAQVRDLMRAVVDSPNGQRNLALEGYSSGGKTGTAERADPDCGCYKGYVTSYVSFAPLNDPEILTYVVVSNPRRGDTGTSVSAPAVRDIMQFALPRYSVEPTAKKTKPRPTEW